MRNVLSFHREPHYDWYLNGATIAYYPLTEDLLDHKTNQKEPINLSVSWSGYSFGTNWSWQAWVQLTWDTYFSPWSWNVRGKHPWTDDMTIAFRVSDFTSPAYWTWWSSWYHSWILSFNSTFKTWVWSDWVVGKGVWILDTGYEWFTRDSSYVEDNSQNPIKIWRFEEVASDSTAAQWYNETIFATYNIPEDWNYKISVTWHQNWSNSGIRIYLDGVLVQEKTSWASIYDTTEYTNDFYFPAKKNWVLTVRAYSGSTSWTAYLFCYTSSILYSAGSTSAKTYLKSYISVVDTFHNWHHTRYISNIGADTPFCENDYSSTKTASQNYIWRDSYGTSNYRYLHWYLRDFVVSWDVRTKDMITKYFNEDLWWQRLPLEYQEVEYVQSNWSPYINSWVSWAMNWLYMVEYDFYTNTSTGDCWFFWRRRNNQWFIFWRSNNEFRLTAWNSWWSSSWVSFSTWRHKLITDGTAWYVDWNKMWWNWWNTMINNNGPMYLFRAWEFTVPNWDMRVYYCKITDKTWDIIREFIPCYRKSDDVIWMYDLANWQFYTNAWDWTFTKWPNV